MSRDEGDAEAVSVRVTLEPPHAMSGPMGTAIISRVPSFRVQRSNEEKSVFCVISRLARHLSACGIDEAGVRDVVERAQALEYPGDFIDVPIE